MKKLLILIAALMVNGCAYNSTTITAGNNSSINCTATVDKPTSVIPSIQGNVPVQGGSVTNPTLNAK